MSTLVITASSSPAEEAADSADCFEDAPEDASELHSEPQEAQQQQQQQPPVALLERNLEDTARVLRLALNNQFIRALRECGQQAHEQLYSSLAHATLSFLKAALTLEKQDLEGALQSIESAQQLSARLRRKSHAAGWISFLTLGVAGGQSASDQQAQADQYTELEMHAELVHAESLLLLTLVSFIADQSLLCLVRGAFRIRACYQRYKECQLLLETRRRWASAEVRRHFESGVLMGTGIFNLLMSYLPHKVLKFLEYVGFSGNRTLGIELLDKSIKLNDRLRSVFSSLVVLTYHSYVEHLFGLGHYDAQKVSELLELSLRDYNQSAFFLLFRGRYFQMIPSDDQEDNLERAIDCFERAIRVQDDWKQFHSICHWEIMWCHAIRQQWDRAAHYSDLLRQTSRWSPASYTYQYATFLYAQQLEQEDASRVGGQMELVAELMGEVPKLRQRYAGKTIPAEKFAIVRAQKFLDQRRRLTLPAVEFLYIWNVFCLMHNQPKHAAALGAKVQRQIERLTGAGAQLAADVHIGTCQCAGDVDESASGAAAACRCFDDLALLCLLKGLCLKCLQEFDEAKQVFSFVLDQRHRIHADHFVAAHCSLELTLVHLIEKQYDRAAYWLKFTKQNFSGYLLETIVHFRLHAASRLIKLECD